MTIFLSLICYIKLFPKNQQIVFCFQVRVAKDIKNCLKARNDGDASQKLKENIESLKWLDNEGYNRTLIHRAAQIGNNTFITFLFEEETVCLYFKLNLDLDNFMELLPLA